jgi:NADPH:quinone reductase-like Zn-dependent oxidoreductase
MFAATFREYGGAEVMRWEEIPDPALTPDGVIVEVHACGLNHSDLDSRAGTSRWRFTFPWVLGAEFAGVVAEIGAEVEGVRPGDPVTAYQQYSCGTCSRCISWRQDLCKRFVVFGTDQWGGYGELVHVPARAVIELTSNDDLVTAAAAQCVVSTAWSLVVSVAGIRPGEIVLVPSASGGVASAAVQCAKIAGATVIATVGAPEKIEPVSALGADVVVSYRNVSIRDVVADVTGGRGVDAVIDTVAGPLFGEHLSSLREDGRLATCGAHAGEVVDLDVVELFRHGWRVLGFRVATPEEIRTSLALALDGRIRVPIAERFALSDAADAHRFMDERRHVGKIVLVHA